MLWCTVSLLWVTDFIQGCAVLGDLVDLESQGKYKFGTMPGELWVPLGGLEQDIVRHD